MDALRTLLRPVARAAGWRAARQRRAFLDACRRTEAVQDALLTRLIASAAGSDFARDRGLERVRSYADFVSAVPVGDYETLRPYVRRAMEGRAEALFAPGTPLVMFATTSGTTGEPKYIPVTPGFVADYRRGWNVFGVGALADHPAAWLRKIVTIASSPRESAAPSGVPCGSISGLLAETQWWIVRRMYPVPAPVRDVTDPSAKSYAIVRASIAHDVGIITTANPSSLIKLAEAARDHAERLIRDVRDGTVNPPGELAPEVARRLHFRPDARAARRLEAIVRDRGELLPRHVWNPAFLAHWTGGTVGLYTPRVRAYYGPAPVRDIGLLASEGRLSIPLADETPAGAAEILGNFLEFIPAGQYGRPSPDVLRAHQVEIGQEYFIVVTNRAGLWRYDIGDRVRVTARLGDCPVFEFLSRGPNSCSITGEKLTEHQVVAAMRDAAAACGTPLELFEVQGRFADLPYYELRLDGPNGLDAVALAGRFDEALGRLNVEYAGKRRGGRLGPVRPVRLPPGTLAARESARLRDRRGRAEQYKHTYLLSEVIPEES